MRLIDADKLTESLNPKESVWVGLVLSELIANTTTVKAIPVEWIKRYANKGGKIANILFPFEIEMMIEDWEQENE